jgi:hypothetical protein
MSAAFWICTARAEFLCACITRAEFLCTCGAGPRPAAGSQPASVLENIWGPVPLPRRGSEKASSPASLCHRPTIVRHLPPARQSSAASSLSGRESDVRRSVCHDGPAARSGPLWSHVSPAASDRSTDTRVHRIWRRNWTLSDARLGDHAQPRSSAVNPSYERVEAPRLAEGRHRQESQRVARANWSALLAGREL